MGIFIAAALASVGALVIVGGITLRDLPREQQRWLLAVVALSLPLWPAAYYLVRVPWEWLLMTGVRLALGAPPVHPGEKIPSAVLGVFGSLQTFSAPLTEEPAKVLLLAIPLLWRRLLPIPSVRVALALGLGFGLSEMWSLAWLLHNKPLIAATPWHQLGGFVTERFMVCFMHGAFTSLAVRGFREGRATGLALSMLLHYFGNLPIFVVALFGMTATQRGILLTLWVYLYFAAMLALLAWQYLGSFQVGRLLMGDAICPECKKEYGRPLIGFNFFTRRYERCPNCGNWHWN